MKAVRDSHDELVRLREENEKLREALEKIAAPATKSGGHVMRKRIAIDALEATK